MRSKQVQGFTIRPQIAELIQEDRPDFTNSSYISEEDLRKYKLKYTTYLSGGDTEIAAQVNAHQTISDDMLLLLDVPDNSLLGSIATWLSSYKFGIALAVLIFLWIAENFWIAFDPYPYNFLDLVLGITVITQSLFIMISQSRNEAKEKLLAINNYKLSLKNEVEITVLREKIDHIKDVQMPEIYKGVKRS